MESTIEQKNIIENIVAGFTKLFTASFFKDKIDKYIRAKYDEGLLKAEDIFQVNFVRNEHDLSFLTDYVNGLVGNTTEQINQDLRAELQRAILDGADIESIKKRVKQIFKDDKYYNRLKTVLRTEGLRAGNKAQLDGAIQSGMNPKKYLSVVLDDRTSEICRAEHKKYGNESQAIPLDEDFIVRVKNKTYRAKEPPFHPNCRSVLLFTEV